MKIYYIPTVIAFFVITQPVEADIFKCVVDGKTQYQAVPCKNEKLETALKIKTSDPDANLRGLQAQQDFELKQQQIKLYQAEIAAKQAEAAREIANANQAAAEADARSREADVYRQSVDAERERSEAAAKYLYKRGGMSPTFKR